MKVVVLSFFILIKSLAVSASTISSTELINSSKKYDGKTVYFEGEVIGEVMKRKDIVWLNLSDRTNSCLGIFAQTSQLPNIIYHGSYKEVGDTIRVKGIFNRACPRHGGELDIHALSLTLVKHGHRREHPINITRVRIALFLALIAITVITATLRLHRNQKIKGLQEVVKTV